MYGIDNAPTGLALTRQRLQHAGLTAHLLRHDVFDGLPFGEAFFDAIVSVQVINYARLAQIIEPGTYIPLDGRETGLPHHYFTPEELHNLFKHYIVMDLHLDGDHHYCLTALKR